MDVTPIRRRPLHEQVGDFIRERILSGEFAPGSQLPSTSALARITGTSVCTVHAATARLEREGLLDRQPNKATFVRGDKPALTCVGIYFNRPLARPDTAFYQALSGELQRKLRERGVACQMWSDDRPEELQNEPLVAARRAVERREIQALIAPLICERDLDWLQQIAVPVSMLTSDLSIKNGVHSDLREMLRLGLEDLAARGCRTVGLINNMFVPEKNGEYLESEFYSSLVDLIGEAGLETRNEWIRVPTRQVAHLAPYGYEQFNRLWDLKRRPEGLLVHPDNAVSGVVTAILERRVRVPRDLKLALHANDLLPYPCPVPASFLVSRVGGFADALLRIIDLQLAEQPPQPINLPVSIVRNSSPFSESLTMPV